MDTYKRTGWHVITYGTYDCTPLFVDVSPQDDKKDHLAGDECWCIPRVLREIDALPVISHNSLDKRELGEPDHWQKAYLGFEHD